MNETKFLLEVLNLFFQTNFFNKKFSRGAVAADGRIQPGDLLLEVNDVSFENMTNEDAVNELRALVHKPG